jgi:predicted amidohydrolase YtcJ
MTSFVLRNANLVEVAGAPGHGDHPVDVRVQDGRVIEVGRNLDHPAGIVEYDAEGRWLIPGLWDHHVHLGQWTQASERLDLTAVRSPEDALALVTTRLRERPDEPIIGWGHRSALWPRPVGPADLDAVTGDRPVVLISGDGHHAWVNTAALDTLALSRRDGVVEEAEWFDAYGRLGQLTSGASTSPAAYLRTMRAAAAMGVVGLTDFEFSVTLDDWSRRAESLPLRVRVATYADTLDEFIGAGLRTGDSLPGCDERITMGPLKIISDGSLNTRTAWCCAPYADRDVAGAPNLTAAELRALLARAKSNGLEVATHAIGDAAVHEALDAYAATGAAGSIEHAQLMLREDIPRLAQLGLRASVQPAHLLDDRDVTEACWPDRADRCFMFRDLVDAGVNLALGSDAPVSPLDPWLAMAAAVHRSADERPAWHGEQALTAREALACSVDGQTTVHAGAVADLALLEADPLVAGDADEAAATRLRTMRVAATWVGGRLVHEAG